jgi:hypothetical protein
MANNNEEIYEGGDMLVPGISDQKVLLPSMSDKASSII